MSVLKWLSVVIALLSAVVVTGLLLLTTGRAGTPIAVGYPTIALIAAGLGLLPGIVLWLVAASYEAELRRTITCTEALEEDGPPQLFRSCFGFGPLLEAHQRTVETLGSRLKRMADQRLDLEVELRVAEGRRQHLEAILNSISDAVIVTDAFNEAVLANEAAAHLLQFDLDPALRQPIEHIVADPTLVKLIKDTRESSYAGSRGRRRHIEHRMGCNGRVTVYDVTLTCVASSPTGANTNRADGSGPFLDVGAGVITILRDITREKEIAEMKSEFVSSVSHELRTPLASIKAYMEMLIDGEAADEQTQAEFYHIIQAETTRLSRLIDNILNLSRIESGVVRVQRKQIALAPVVKEAVDIMQPQGRAKQITLEERPCLAAVQVLADRDMILQVLLNLMGNAVKYTRAGGHITVVLSADENERLARIAVIDTGVGVPQPDLPHLFEKFYRVVSHRKLAEGTGLGLNLVKHVVESVHGGSVSVTSEIGKGSAFTFALPMAENG